MEMNILEFPENPGAAFLDGSGDQEYHPPNLGVPARGIANRNYPRMEVN